MYSNKNLEIISSFQKIRGLYFELISIQVQRKIKNDLYFPLKIKNDLYLMYRGTLYISINTDYSDCMSTLCCEKIDRFKYNLCNYNKEEYPCISWADYLKNNPDIEELIMLRLEESLLVKI